MSSPFIVDELDFRILRELFAGDTPSFRSDRVPLDAVAHRLGIHRNTVTARVKTLLEQRFYLPPGIGINPGAVGMVRGFALLRSPTAGRSDDVIDQLFQIAGVSNVFVYTDALHVIMHANDAATLDSRLQEAKLLTGASEATWHLHSARDFPAFPPVRLSLPEARLIPLLFADARAPFSTIAKRLGVSARTVEETYSRLRKRMVIFQVPSGEVHEYPGLAVAFLHVRLGGSTEEQAKTKERLLHDVPNHFVRMMEPKGWAHLTVYGASLAELEAMADRVRGLQGVQGVELGVLVRKRQNLQWAEWLATHLLDWAARPVPAR